MRSPGLAIAVAMAITTPLFFSSCSVDSDSQPPSELASLSSALNPSETQAVASALSQYQDSPGWPAMPRLWADVSKEEYLSGEIQVGLKIGFMGVESQATHNVTLSKGRRTTFIMITTKTQPGQQLTRRENGHVYINVLEGSSHVGLCVYTSFLTMNRSLVGRISAYGSAVGSSTGLKDLISRTNYSQFFELSPVKTPNYYLSDVCESIFRSEVQESVEEDLKNLASDILVYSHPQTSCVPPAADEPRLRGGDQSCISWHRQLLPGVVAWTAPRCESSREGYYRCVLRSKENGSCPFYRQSDGQLTTNPTQEAKLITAGMFEYPCDHHQGLTCRLVEEDGWFSSARAECKPRG